MAKMFYSVQEASQKLGMDEEKVRELGASGKLQVFRDRDKLMFKRDQVDELAEQSTEASAASGTAPGLSGSAISLQDSQDTAVDLSADSHTAALDDSSQASGVNVFETGEVDSADPKAQTRVTQAADEDELALESVGSGSGLLDLTRESDDTSLGAELLDELNLGDTAGGSGIGTAPGASALESGMDLETSASGLEHLQTAGTGGVGIPVMIEPYDPAWSGAGAGLLLGAMVSLIVALIVGAYAAAGVTNSITRYVAEQANPLMGVLIVAGGLLVLSLVAGGIGYFVGGMRKAAA